MDVLMLLGNAEAEAFIMPLCSREDGIKQPQVLHTRQSDNPTSCLSTGALADCDSFESQVPAQPHSICQATAHPSMLSQAASSQHTQVDLAVGPQQVKGRKKRATKRKAASGQVTGITDIHVQRAMTALVRLVLCAPARSHSMHRCRCLHT